MDKNFFVFVIASGLIVTIGCFVFLGTGIMEDDTIKIMFGFVFLMLSPVIILGREYLKIRNSMDEDEAMIKRKIRSEAVTNLHRLVKNGNH